MKLESFLLPCINKQVFGIECFGCGFQRSVILLIKGNFIEAFFMYPAIYTIIPLAIVALANVHYKSQKLTKLVSVLAIASIAIIVTNFVIKLIN